MKSKRRVLVRFTLFFVIAALSGFAANLLSSLFRGSYETSRLDMSNLIRMRERIEINYSVIDSDEDGIYDTYAIRIEGVPGFELSYLVGDLNQNGVFDTLNVRAGTETQFSNQNEQLYMEDIDGDDSIDIVAFRLINRSNPTTGITYVYRDLDLNGLLDVMTLYQGRRPAQGYILYGSEWLPYLRRVVGTSWHQVEMEDEAGEVTIASFENGQWTFGPKTIATESAP